MDRDVEFMRQLKVASTHHLVFYWWQVVLGASCEYYRRESDEDVIELAEILHDSDLYRVQWHLFGMTEQGVMLAAQCWSA